MRESVRIAAVVVLYRPGPEVVDNTLTWLGQVDRAFIVDNSEGENLSLVLPLLGEGRAVYLPNRSNVGVARALNIGAEAALSDGCDYLLTMDQDSRASSGMVEMLRACFAGSNGRVGMVAPFLVTRPGEEPPATPACEPMPTAMTSGSLLSLAAYRSVGPFLDDFFIDFVDIEYALRIRAGGFVLLRANGALLHHAVGNLIAIPLAGRTLRVTTHAPLRKYYKTRNRCLVWQHYGSIFPGYCRQDQLRFVLELLRLLLFEPEKLAKMKMMWRGWRDFRVGRFGIFRDREP